MFHCKHPKDEDANREDEVMQPDTNNRIFLKCNLNNYLEKQEVVVDEVLEQECIVELTHCQCSLHDSFLRDNGEVVVGRDVGLAQTS